MNSPSLSPSLKAPAIKKSYALQGRPSLFGRQRLAEGDKLRTARPVNSPSLKLWTARPVNSEDHRLINLTFFTLSGSQTLISPMPRCAQA